MSEALQKLRSVSEARFDDGASGRAECTPSTRREILSSMWSWIVNEQEAVLDPAFHISKTSFILWINGLAGTGKSTIAQTLARLCDGGKLLGASFFCARTGGRSNVQLIFPTIAYQLSLLNPVFAEEVAKEIGRAHV